MSSQGLQLTALKGVAKMSLYCLESTVPAIFETNSSPWKVAQARIANEILVIIVASHTVVILLAK